MSYFALLIRLCRRAFFVLLVLCFVSSYQIFSNHDALYNEPYKKNEDIEDDVSYVPKIPLMDILRQINSAKKGTVIKDGLTEITNKGLYFLNNNVSGCIKIDAL